MAEAWELNKLNSRGYIELEVLDMLAATALAVIAADLSQRKHGHGRQARSTPI